ncbi:hypothetical protein PHK61_03780 [Actinomycetospora lutea]|uniref:hypothetical protein n=1 Tax=Actinomycetospora lutea TaxID=663604 RepID=UPI002366D6B0|nr:hypothetical protein [Actinomycetospora lutea]MDD7937537.1 hypothetical protein [Actinomycetospora lutea]
MVLTVTVLGVVVVAGLLLVARYGADSRVTGDPTGRDPMWPSRPVRDHTPASDLRLVRAWLARVDAHRRCWDLFERTLRPWEAPSVERTRRSVA